MPNGHARMLRHLLLLLTAAGCLAAPAAAHAGVAISTAPDLPGGNRAGTTVKVKETGVPGSISMTQIFTGADSAAIARVELIQLAPACGPGPSPGNPDTNGPALNTPELPCSNPDVGVFGGFGASGVGGGACVGNTFTLSPPDANGQVTVNPAQQVYLTNGQTCSISFTFNVRQEPSKDTFPKVAGMNTTSVSAVRSEIVANPGNPRSIGLEAAALGSGGTVLVESKSEKGKLGTPPKLEISGVCVKNVLRASVSGSGISKVIFLLDDSKIDVDKSKPFKLVKRVGKLRKGRHELTARVIMKSGQGSNKVLTDEFFSCRAPSFTG